MTTQEALIAAGATIFGAILVAVVALGRNRQDAQSSFRDALLKEINSIRRVNQAHDAQIEDLLERVHALQLIVEECVAVRNSLKLQVEQLTREVAELKKRLTHYETE